MPKIVRCTACGLSLNLPDGIDGQKVRCPACKEVFEADDAANDAFSARRPELSERTRGQETGFQEFPRSSSEQVADANRLRVARRRWRHPSDDIGILAKRRYDLTGQGVGLACMICLGIYAVLSLGLLAVDVGIYAIILEGAAQPGSDLDLLVDVEQVLVGLLGLLTLTIAVLLPIWMYHAYRNLSALRVGGQMNSPGWAAASFFIPVYNIFKPIIIMQEIWRGSSPRVTLDNEFAWKQEWASIIAGFWWFFYFTASVLQNIANAMQRNENPNIEFAKAAVMLEIINSALWLAAAVLLILVMSGIMNRQRAKFALIRADDRERADLFADDYDG